LTEEEELTKIHKNQIDSEVDIVKEEMKLLFEVQRPNSDIRQYVDTLHAIILHKLDMIGKLKT